jgi:hypothetical protein
MRLPNNRDPKPLSDKSEWVGKPRENFTREMEKLWNDRQPKTERGAGMNQWPAQLQRPENAA